MQVSKRRGSGGVPTLTELLPAKRLSSKLPLFFPIFPGECQAGWRLASLCLSKNTRGSDPSRSAPGPGDSAALRETKRWSFHGRGGAAGLPPLFAEILWFRQGRLCSQPVVSPIASPSPGPARAFPQRPISKVNRGGKGRRFSSWRRIGFLE
jgi:hypothetical protein